VTDGPEDRPPDSTADRDYADRLVALQTARWKRIVDVQRPYRRHLRRLRLGDTLDVGCGIGRNLETLGPGSVGIDHNADSVALCRARGLRAYTSDEFEGSEDAVQGRFDSLLFAHVLEHMDRETSVALVRTHLGRLVSNGRVVVITPQERGFRSDPTHVEFLDFDAVREIAAATGVDVERSYSFPFPRAAGRVFTYNEFVVIARRASSS
jgi:2-polyprenyl-3-methyl-5-hydroxy-6-metoxy-1,4-benzoquinol methylase